MKGNFLAVIAGLFALNSFAADVVDLNNATQQELESIHGIGPAKASAIIEYRTQHGGFKSLDELDNVPGFGPKHVEKMRAAATVHGGSASAAPAVKAGIQKKPLYGFMDGDLGLIRDEDETRLKAPTDPHHR